MLYLVTIIDLFIEGPSTRVMTEWTAFDLTVCCGVALRQPYLVVPGVLLGFRLALSFLVLFGPWARHLTRLKRYVDVYQRSSRQGAGS